MRVRVVLRTGRFPGKSSLILSGTGDDFMMEADDDGFELEEQDLAYWAYEYAYKDGRINASSLVNDLEIELTHPTRLNREWWQARGRNCWAPGETRSMWRVLFALRPRRILGRWAAGKIDYSTARRRFEQLANNERRAA